MTTDKRPARVRRTPPSGWTAFCRRCWWYRSYSTHQVAVHAATQHVRHLLARESGVPF